MNYTIHFIVRGLLSFSFFLFLLFLSEILYKDISTKNILIFVSAKKYEISVLRIGRMFLIAEVFLFPIKVDGEWGGGEDLSGHVPSKKAFLVLHIPCLSFIDNSWFLYSPFLEKRSYSNCVQRDRWIVYSVTISCAYAFRDTGGFKMLVNNVWFVISLFCFQLFDVGEGRGRSSGKASKKT